MLSVPTSRLDVVSDATPLFRGAVPRRILPFIKLTVPVGVLPPAVDAATLAVKVMGLPEIELVAVDESIVVVAV